MSAIIDTFIEEARAVTIGQAAERLQLKFRRAGNEHPQPCPVKGGTDMFAFNTVKNTWNCRGCGVGGRDAIGMAAHCLGLDVSRRAEFLDTCEAVTGQPVPAEGERESDEDRAARLARLEAAKAKAAADAQKQQRARADFRERERRRARGIYDVAEPLVSARLIDGRAYLKGRGACIPPDGWLRFSAEQTYWHGQDERGDPLSLHVGPAMVASLIDRATAVIGCHITWIDLGRPPKLRPAIVDPRTGEVLPTKKMRGSKKGGIIPLTGYLPSRRWVGGEGIENTLAFASWEGFRTDTFYFAAGDLGNLAGPAEPSSAFAHPNLTKVDKRGVTKPVMVPGAVPRISVDADDAVWIGDQVDELVLLADADSERVMTAAAMARARARHARPGLRVLVVWPKRGLDFSDLALDLAGND